MDKFSFEDVKQFTVKEIWDLPEINENTCLVHDFQIAGLDGYDYMNAYSKRFNVDLDGFEWGKYFGPEASASPLDIINYFYNRLIKRIPKENLLIYQN